MHMDFQKASFEGWNRSIHLMKPSVFLGLLQNTLDLLKYQIGMDLW